MCTGVATRMHIAHNYVTEAYKITHLALSYIHICMYATCLSVWGGDQQNYAPVDIHYALY